jgi:formyltetrahydrofolate synthetase
LVLGVEPEGADDARRSLLAGRILRLPQAPRTRADGVRTLAMGELPFRVMREKVDGVLTVSEEAILEPHQYRPLYPLEAPLEAKVETIAKEVYGAQGVEWSEEAKKALKAAKKEGCEALPVVMAKAATSLSDNPRLRGRPTGFTVRVTDLRCRLGAGFVVVYMGGIETLPGLPKLPQALKIDVDEEGNIRGMDY